MLSAMSHATGNSKSRPIDWWFMYKIPRGIGPKGKSTGFEYVYADDRSTSSANGKFKLDSHTLDKPGSAMEHTLRQIFETKDPNVGYVIWNDELPENLKTKVSKSKRKIYRYSADGSSYGHTKGVLAFNVKENSGFYLLHSTPKFPAVNLSPEDDMMVEAGQARNGQTYICVTLKDFDTADNIAEVLNFNHRPQVYHSNIKGVSPDDAIYELVNGPRFPKALKKTPPGRGYLQSRQPEVQVLWKERSLEQTTEGRQTENGGRTDFRKGPVARSGRSHSGMRP